MENGGLYLFEIFVYIASGLVWDVFLSANSPFCMLSTRACICWAPCVDTCVLKHGLCFGPNKTNKNNDFRTTPESGLVWIVFCCFSLVSLLFFGPFVFCGSFGFGPPVYKAPQTGTLIISPTIPKP